MHSIKLRLFGWELILQPAMKLHITIFPEKEYVEEKPYVLKYTIEERVSAMAGDHQFIDYIFRDFDVALLTYREYAAVLLEDVMNSLRRIRNILEEKGATPELLSIYDNKVHECFMRTVSVVEGRAEDKYNDEDKDLLKMITSYEIDNYHCGNKWCEQNEINSKDDKTSR